jgi:hypothetical protein
MRHLKVSYMIWQVIPGTIAFFAIVRFLADMWVQLHPPPFKDSSVKDYDDEKLQKIAREKKASF